MKNSIAKVISTLFVVLVLASSFTSCTRKGTGCPYELKVAKTIIKSAVK